jgi:ABC-three component (ABC-3C) system Middle Component 3
MSAWEERSRDAARLFNPAFLAALIAAAAGDYEDRAESPMPWLLAFLVPPLVLAESTRAALPGSIGASFANWLDQHPEVRLGFSRRAPALTPLTREGMRVGVREGVLVFEDGYLHAARRPGAAQDTSDEVTDCLHASRFFGRWFARRLDPTTIYGLLGVRP